MSEKPILFNTEMVRAILDGRKTQTRRVIRFPEGTTGHLPPSGARDYIYWPGGIKRAPYQPGDILYVRETWKQYTTGTAGPGLIDGYLYKADEPQDTSRMMVEDRWHPSIHMPKEAARIWLRVTDVRAEHLQDITEDDAYLEGYAGCKGAHAELPCWVGGEECHYGYWYCDHSPQEGFGLDVWDNTLKREDVPQYGWAANPWVWVIAFERINKT